MHSEGIESDKGKAKDPGYPSIGLDYLQVGIGEMYRGLNPDLTVHDMAAMVLEDITVVLNGSHWIEQATWRNWAQTGDRYDRVRLAIGYALLELVHAANLHGFSALSAIHEAFMEQVSIGFPMGEKETKEYQDNLRIREQASRMFESWQREQEGKDVDH